MTQSKGLKYLKYFKNSGGKAKVYNIKGNSKLHPAYLILNFPSYVLTPARKTAQRFIAYTCISIVLKNHFHHSYLQSLLKPLKINFPYYLYDQKLIISVLGANFVIYAFMC